MHYRIFIVSILTILFQANSVYAANPACTLTAGKVDASTSSCGITPAIQTINILQVKLCTSKPSAPTTGSALDESKCSNSIFSGGGGRKVTIQTDAETSVSDGQSTQIPAAKTYTYALIKLSPYVILNASAEFDDTVTARDGTSGDTTSGTICWTKTSSMYMNTSVWDTTSCGGTIGAQGSTTVYINKLGDGVTESFTGSQGNPIDLYLANEANKLSSTPGTSSLGDISKIIGIVKISDNITTVKQAYKPKHSLKMYIANSTAALIDTDSMSPEIVFRVGLFDIYMTYACGGHKNCPK